MSDVKNPPKKPGKRAISATIQSIRRASIAATLFEPTTLGRAVRRLGFVQADPIRSPARAQDLILRHRVLDYRAGDLETRFARLGLAEDFLYAYGFVPDTTLRLLHPRHDPDGPEGRHLPTGLAADVLAFVRERRQTHPRDLEARFGRERAMNGWGGVSKATTRALQSLHHHGLIRVAKRRDGIRVYAPALPHGPRFSPEERLRRLIVLVMRILAPISPSSLRSTLRLLSRGAPGLGDMNAMVATLLKAGELESCSVEGETYLRLALSGTKPTTEVRPSLRFLAPFDPIVWDRRRFAHLWGWTYRFEAYTPPAKRNLGYYAMPMLWGENVIGWANFGMSDDGLQAELGYVERAAAGREFKRALDAELAAMEIFLRGRERH
jgi:uncharacterized protein